MGADPARKQTIEARAAHATLESLRSVVDMIDLARAPTPLRRELVDAERELTAAAWHGQYAALCAIARANRALDTLGRWLARDGGDDPDSDEKPNRRG